MSRSGSVLVLVVWVISLLSMLAAGLGSQSLSALGFVDGLDQRLQASYIASGALQRAVQVLADDATEHLDGLSDDWANCAGCFERQPLAGGQFTISNPAGLDRVLFGMVDEERKLSLNAMPAEVFAALLVRQGQLKPIDADDVAEAIVDWRDEDHEQLPHGAESFYYKGLNPGYACKDAPFEHVEELLLVRGVTPALLERLAPWVTPYGSGRLNLNTAGRGAFEALGLSSLAVDALIRYRDGEDGQPATGDERLFASVPAAVAELMPLMPADDHARFTRMADTDLFGVSSSVFRASIQARTEGADGTAAHVECVLDRKGSVLAWAER
jgi:general secretion pathway protein K